MRERIAENPPIQEVIVRYRSVLRKEILKELGVESEAAKKELSERTSRQAAEAEQARQELQQRVEDGEKRLEIEVQNVEVSLRILLTCA